MAHGLSPVRSRRWATGQWPEVLGGSGAQKFGGEEILKLKRPRRFVESWKSRVRQRRGRLLSLYRRQFYFARTTSRAHSMTDWSNGSEEEIRLVETDSVSYRHDHL